MSIKNALDELEEICNELDSEGRRDVWLYGQLLIKSQEVGLEPPTAAQWERVPQWARFWVWLRIAYHVTWGKLSVAWVKWSRGDDHLL
jgi:hypothetical protein